jgi:hypothetical protein
MMLLKIEPNSSCHHPAVSQEQQTSSADKLILLNIQVETNNSCHLSTVMQEELASCSWKADAVG